MVGWLVTQGKKQLPKVLVMHGQQMRFGIPTRKGLPVQ